MSLRNAYYSSWRIKPDLRTVEGRTLIRIFVVRELVRLFVRLLTFLIAFAYFAPDWQCPVFIRHWLILQCCGREREYIKYKSQLCREFAEMQQAIQQGLPAKVLEEKAAAFRNAKANKELADEIPKGSDIYEQRVSVFSKLRKIVDIQKHTPLDKLKGKGGEIVSFKALKAGSLSAGENQVVSIPLVPPQGAFGITQTDFEIQELRELDVKNAGKGKESEQARALHVGAIEIVMHSYASPDSDLMGGMLLCDTHHTRIENAVRSIFISPFRGGAPIRVVTFPNTIVEIGPDMNERFKLICTTSNGDIRPGANLALVYANVVGCTVSLERTAIPTKLYASTFAEEHGTIVQYLKRQTYAMHNVNIPDNDMLLQQHFDFRMDGPMQLKKLSSSSARFMPGGKLSFHVGPCERTPENKEESTSDPEKLSQHLSKLHLGSTVREGIDPHDGRVSGYGDIAFSQGEISLFKLSLDDTREPTGSDLDLCGATVWYTLPKTMGIGDVIVDIPLVNMLVQQAERATRQFYTIPFMTTTIKIVATINVPENTGCGLVMSVNSGYRGVPSLDVYTVCSQDTQIWNPACKATQEMEFNPNPCWHSWNREILRRTGYRFSIICAAGWTTTPLTDLVMTVKCFLTTNPCVPRIYTFDKNVETIVMNRWMGRLDFDQGATRQMKRMSLSIGGGAGAKDAVLMNMPNAFISLWRYFTGKLRFEITKLSSPYIKGTICFFIQYGDLPDTSTIFESFPNKLVKFAEVQDRIVLEFTAEHFLTAWSTQQRPANSLLQDGCPYLYAVSHDCAASTIAGKLILGVRLLEIENFQGFGFNPGIVGARLLNTIGTAQVQGDMDFNREAILNQYCRLVKLSADTSISNYVTLSVDLINGGVTNSSNLTLDVSNFNSPVANVLHTATWKKGRMLVQVTFQGIASVTRANWQCVVEMFLRNSLDASHYDARRWVSAQPHAWQLEFYVDIIGPNNGFEMAGANWSNQTSWFLEFVIANPQQFGSIYINVALEDGFQIAGNSITPSFPDVVGAQLVGMDYDGVRTPHDQEAMSTVRQLPYEQRKARSKAGRRYPEKAKGKQEVDSDLVDAMSNIRIKPLAMD